MIDEKIQTFIIVAEQKNFTKASNILHLTQPAVSTQIRLLEEELNVTLISRKSNDFLTDEGKVFLEYCYNQVKQYNELKTKLNKKKQHTRLKIGVTRSLENNFISRTLGIYAVIHPEYKISIITDNAVNLLTMLENNQLDFIIVGDKINHTSFNSIKLDSDTLVCVMSNDSTLKNKKYVTLNDIKTMPLIMRHSSSETRKLFDTQLQKQNDNIKNYNVIMSIDSISTIKYLINQNLGISILPYSACIRDANKGKLIIKNIKDINLERETTIIYPKDFNYIENIKDIISEYKKHLNYYYENEF